MNEFGIERMTKEEAEAIIKDISDPKIQKAIEVLLNETQIQ